MKFQRIPHISPTPDSVMMLPTWSEIGGHPELKMAAMKTGGENNFLNRRSWQSASIGCPYIFSDARLRYNTADMG